MATLLGTATPAEREVAETLTFRRQLHASALAREIARLLKAGHFAYEGWPIYDDEPYPIHQQTAELAVRLCVEPVRVVALSQAVQHGLRTFETFQIKLASPDATEEKRDELIGDFVRECIGVHLYHLKNEHGRSDAETRAFEAGEEDSE